MLSVEMNEKEEETLVVESRCLSSRLIVACILLVLETLGSMSELGELKR